ncbi:hypothetical protein CYMTET_26305 [Cymbomonas tetramitiformis]|uniref:Uncharacterized protein n=1 Tax=Cymbomonas tetramitiformis TaxID=36881 RepID=A0AAE0FSL2_9CHLO|nr:hypothetical protein CYMTET_26305 [Cymbomonas tetramitiformis]
MYADLEGNEGWGTSYYLEARVQLVVDALDSAAVELCERDAGDRQLEHITAQCIRLKLKCSEVEDLCNRQRLDKCLAVDPRTPGALAVSHPQLSLQPAPRAGHREDAPSTSFWTATPKEASRSLVEGASHDSEGGSPDTERPADPPAGDMWGAVRASQSAVPRQRKVATDQASAATSETAGSERAAERPSNGVGAGHGMPHADHPPRS